MIYIRNLTTPSDVQNSLHALDVLSGKKTKEPDYQGYTDGKRILYAECRSLEEYDAKRARLAEECGL